MLGSSDLLRKKICVTVFLDELFEELHEETHESPTGKSREVNSGVRITEEPPDEQVNLFTYKSQPSNEYVRKNGPKPRPRKPRQQSKFGKLKNDLTTECRCCSETQNKDDRSQESAESSAENSSISHFVTSNNKSTMTIDSFLSEPKVSSQRIDREVDCSLKVSVFSKSIQFDSPDVKIKKDEVLLNKQQQTDVNNLGNVRHYWTDTGCSHDDKTDEINHFDLKSLLEDYVKMEERRTSHILEDLPKQDSLFIASSSEKISNFTPQEVIRIWSTCMKVWNEDFESEMSEVEYHVDGNKVAEPLSLVSNPDVNAVVVVEETENYAAQLLTSASSDLRFSRSLRKNDQYKQQTKSAILEVSGSKETRTLEQSKLRVIVEPTGRLFECRSKTFAEDDTFEELSSSNIFQFDANENVITRNKVLSEEPKEVIMNKTKVHFLSSKILETVPRQVAEVFIKKKNGNSDTESEMVFAENPTDEEDSQEVFEFDDTTSVTKFPKQMKAVEIFGGASVHDMKNISTELLLISDDINKERILMEGWKGNFKSLSEMKELYLKDLNESTTYLIKIPLHFINSNRKGSVIFENNSDLQ